MRTIAYGSFTGSMLRHVDGDYGGIFPFLLWCSHGHVCSDDHFNRGERPYELFSFCYEQCRLLSTIHCASNSTQPKSAFVKSSASPPRISAVRVSPEIILPSSDLISLQYPKSPS